MKRLKVGDEVFGVTSIRRAGAFADYVVADEKSAWLKPRSLSFEQAAAFTIVGLTAWNALVAKAKLSAGQSVLITGCLGGVGRSAVQIACMRGANIVGSCSASGREEALAREVTALLEPVLATVEGGKATRDIYKARALLAEIRSSGSVV